MRRKDTDAGMLKYLFAGGAIAGFILAVATGYGYSPTGILNGTGVAMASKSASESKPALTKTNAAKPAPAQAAAGAPPSAAVPPTLNPANLAQSLQTIAPGLSGAVLSSTSNASITSLLSGLGGQPGQGGQGSPLDLLGSLMGNAGNSNQAGALSGLLGGNPKVERRLLNNLNDDDDVADILSSLLRANGGDVNSLVAALTANNPAINRADLQRLLQSLR